MVVLDNPMMYTKFQGHRPLDRGMWYSKVFNIVKFKRILLQLQYAVGLGHKFSQHFYHIWTWTPSWSCGPEHLNTFSSQHPMEAPYEIWLQTKPSVSWGKEVWNCWIWVTLDKGQWMTLTFDVHIKLHVLILVNCIYQLWYHSLQQFLKNPSLYTKA